MTEDEFKVLKNFVGYGNPKGKFWFFGIEEAGESRENDLETYKREIVPVAPGEIRKKAQKEGKRFTKVYHYMSYLALRDSVETPSSKECLEYRNKELLQAHSQTFQANLYPIGKKSLTSWNEQWIEATGYKKVSEYYEDMEEMKVGGRFYHLRSRWDSFAPQLTICFGATHWDKFEKLLLTEEWVRNNEADLTDRTWYKIYQLRNANRSIILCPFFGNRQMKKDNKGKEYKEILGEEISRIFKGASTQ